MIVCPGFVRTDLQTRALGPDGKIATDSRTTIGREDTPQSAAKQIVRALVKRKPMLVLTLAGKLGYLLSRLSPMLYERLMTHQFREELRESSFSE